MAKSKNSKPVVVARGKGKGKKYANKVSVQQQVSWRANARRKKQIELGMTVKSGAGFHEDGKKTRNKKERRQHKLETKGGGDGK